MKKKKLFRKKLPLTLLEIMIVIFLIGLISSVIGFNMKGSLDKAKAFKTEKAIAQIQEILLLDIAQGNLTLKEIMLQDGSINKPVVEKCLERSGMVKDFKKALQDGWDGEYKITSKKDAPEEFEIVSEKLIAYKAKNNLSK